MIFDIENLPHFYGMFFCCLSQGTKWVGYFKRQELPVYVFDQHAVCPTFVPSSKLASCKFTVKTNLSIDYSTSL